MRPTRLLRPLLPTGLQCTSIHLTARSVTGPGYYKLHPFTPSSVPGKLPVLNERHVNDGERQSQNLRLGLPVALDANPVDNERNARTVLKRSGARRTPRPQTYDHPIPFTDVYQAGKVNVDASNVLLVRGINQNVTEADFVRAVPGWGTGEPWLLRGESGIVLFPGYGGEKY
jgi:hypothetical protein